MWLCVIEYLWWGPKNLYVPLKDIIIIIIIRSGILQYMCKVIGQSCEINAVLPHWCGGF